jgi:hypothetical protein
MSPGRIGRRGPPKAVLRPEPGLAGPLAAIVDPFESSSARKLPPSAARLPPDNAIFKLENAPQS